MRVLFTGGIGRLVVMLAAVAAIGACSSAAGTDSGGPAASRAEDCPAGGCEQVCTDPDGCLLRCDGGKCLQRCAKGAGVCNFACERGGCYQICEGRSCALSCRGGDCLRQSDAPCAETCGAGGCKRARGLEARWRRMTR